MEQTLLAKAIEEFNTERSKLTSDVSQLAWNLAMVQGLRGDLIGPYIPNEVFYSRYEKIRTVISSLYNLVDQLQTCIRFDEVQKRILSSSDQNILKECMEKAARTFQEDINYFKELYITNTFKKACDNLTCNLLRDKD